MQTSKWKFYYPEANLQRSRWRGHSCTFLKALTSNCLLFNCLLRLARTYFSIIESSLTWQRAHRGLRTLSVGQTQRSLPVCHSPNTIFNHTSGAPTNQSEFSQSLLLLQKCQSWGYEGYVCERQNPAPLQHGATFLWQMARPFEEQSTAIDIKLPALKTEGPARPRLFTVSQRTAPTARPVTNAAFVSRWYTL